MKKFIKGVAKMIIAVVLGLVYMWFSLSFAWSLAEMSVAEKIAGVAYAFLMMPIYYGLKKLFRLL